MRPFFVAFALLIAAVVLQQYFFVAPPEMIIPGWHTTVFPAYYLPGYVLSAAALLMLVLQLVRWFSRYKEGLMLNVIDAVGQVMLAAALVAGLCWLGEMFRVWSSGAFVEQLAFYNRVYGIWWSAFFLGLFAQLMVPHLFWWKKIRLNGGMAFAIALLISSSWIMEKFSILVSLVGK